MLKGRKLLNGKEIYIKPHLSVWKRHLWPGTVTFQIYIDAKVIAAVSHIESDSQLILTAQLLICARVHCDSIIWGIFPQLVNIIFNRESIKLLSLNGRDYVHYVLWAENYILQLTYPRSFNFETYVMLCITTLHRDGVPFTGGSFEWTLGRPNLSSSTYLLSYIFFPSHNICWCHWLIEVSPLTIC